MKALALAILLVAVIGTAPAGLANNATQPPQDVVQQTTDDVLKTLRQHRNEYASNPDKVYHLIDEVLLPNFDVDYAARLVLGRYWRTATPDQRKEFEQAFYDYLLHSYADSLVKYSDTKVKVIAGQISPDGKRALVRSQVDRRDGPPVKVDYALHRTGKGWKAFDVSIEGISYVTSYRHQFSTEIQQTSLDALIKRLRGQAGDTSSHKLPGGGKPEAHAVDGSGA